jgi:hypothetical protein
MFLFSNVSTNLKSVFSVGRITSCIENITNEKVRDPISIFKSEDKIYSLAFHREFLIVGSAGYVVGFSVSSGIILKKMWTIQLPGSHSEMNEVNSMWIDSCEDSASDLMYVASGNEIFILSLDEGSFIKKLTGHSDYIHSVHGL